MRSLNHTGRGRHCSAGAGAKVEPLGSALALTERLGLRGATPAICRSPPRPCIRAPHGQSRFDNMRFLSHTAPRRAQRQHTRRDARF
jgi:hypothetical protein